MADDHKLNCVFLLRHFNNRRGLDSFLHACPQTKGQNDQTNLRGISFRSPRRTPEGFYPYFDVLHIGTGKVVEALYARVSQNSMQTTYAFWGYSMDGRLVAGGGLFVGVQGIVTDHHFVLGKNSNKPVFLAGPLSVTICGRVVGKRSEQRLYQIDLALTEEQANSLNNGRAGVGFERGPDTDRFHASIVENPSLKRNQPGAEAMRDLLK